MNILAQLKPAPGSRQKRRRLGRGIGSGRGGTSTKGHKGQKSRSGFSLKRGFEGGQVPLVRRLPKFGFTNKRFKTHYDLVGLSDLNRFGSEVDPSSLCKAGLVRKRSLIKIVTKGKLNKSITVKAHKFTQSAKNLIEKAGGHAEVINMRSASIQKPGGNVRS